MTELQQDNTGPRASLWSDEPSTDDLLSFDALALTLIDPLLDDALDPLALGISGPWGSGKSTVLGLIQVHLGELSEDGSKIIVVSTQPWRYDPTVGAKETLIGEVIDALQAEVVATASPESDAFKLVRKLAGRVDWAKALKVAAKAGIAMQIPSVDDLIDLVKPKSPAEGESGDRSLDTFRAEFAKLMSSEELDHVKAVVVLVDDLDRCLPRTVVESLEAIRLFLSVSKMSFVIAADEHRVADALRAEFPTHQPVDAGDVEDPAELYLHKIVQTTLPIPALNRFDTQAYIVLLQIQAGTNSSELARLTALCNDFRQAGKTLDALEAIDAELFADEISFAARLTPVLYEKLRGNPRRIKRFLNDLNIRRAVARRRGIELDAAVVAKMMVLEVLFKDDFNQVLEWLAKSELRSQITELESAAGRPEAVEPAPEEETPSPPAAKKTAGTGLVHSTGVAKTKPKADEQPRYSESMLRWAKLPPSLTGLDLAPYLYLAASFKAQPMLDLGLPERLKDIASNMLGATRREREAVSDMDLRALQPRDTDELANYFGRLVRDQPSQQKLGVTALLRISRNCVDGPRAAARALLMIPIGDISMGTPLLFTPSEAAEVREVLATWKRKSQDGQVRTAIDEALKVSN